MSGDINAHLAKLALALQPLIDRVRTDVTAMKVADGSSRWVREPLTPGRLLQHLGPGPARGVCPIREGESTTRVGLYDLDSHGGETSWEGMVEVAQLLMDTLELDGNAPQAFRSSGGRGIHIYLIWDEPQDAYSVRAYMTDVLHAIGFKNGAKGVQAKQIEVFPKQDRVGEGEFGNQFILPLAGKSEPMDPLYGLAPMGRDWITNVAWAASPPVERREREAVSSAGAGGNPPEDISRVREALYAIPNDGGDDSPDYDRWRDLAFAAHEATGGSEEGLALFEEWSAQNPKHDGKFLEKRVWPYIKDGDGRGRQITRGTLFAEASRAGWMDVRGLDADGFDDVPEAEMAPDPAVTHAKALQKYGAKADWKKAIHEAPDEFTLREKVCAKIALDKMLNGIDRELLAEEVKTRFVALGSKLSIAACRKLVMPARVKHEDSHLPKWCRGWVYVTDDDKFFRLDSDEWLTMQAFNARFNRELPRGEDDDQSFTAGWFVLTECGMETVTRAVYLPWADPIFELDGVRCANAFRPSSMPKAAEHYTQAGRRAIKLVKQHIAMLAGGRQDVVEVLLSWMAYNTQNPGKKVRWAPLVKGVEGDGKTLIGRVMSAVIGPSNVKDISPKVLGTDFTAWAQGACVGVLEEIRLAGHNRHDILNALKPYITNNSVAIHAKGKDEYNTINTMNYIAFTNHADALPLGDSDRRWFIVFTPFITTADLLAAIGSGGAYFDTLYEAIEQNRGELRKWLLEYQVSDRFNPNGSAPMTSEKQSMIALSVSPEEEAVIAALEAGGPGIGPTVLATSYLSRVVREIDGEIDLKTSALARVLAKLGWQKVPKPIKWAGDTHRVWAKSKTPPENEQIRAELDKTLVTSGLGELGEDPF
jgi:hypothetical protein